MKDPVYTQRLPFAGRSYEGNPILKIPHSCSFIITSAALSTYDKSL